MSFQKLKEDLKKWRENAEQWAAPGRVIHCSDPIMTLPIIIEKIEELETKLTELETFIKEKFK